jgi:hypothetical protein
MRNATGAKRHLFEVTLVQIVTLVGIKNESILYQSAYLLVPLVRKAINISANKFQPSRQNLIITYFCKQIHHKYMYDAKHND